VVLLEFGGEEGRQKSAKNKFAGSFPQALPSGYMHETVVLIKTGRKSANARFITQTTQYVYQC